MEYTTSLEHKKVWIHNYPDKLRSIDDLFESHLYPGWRVASVNSPDFVMDEKTVYMPGNSLDYDNSPLLASSKEEFDILVGIVGEFCNWVNAEPLAPATPVGFYYKAWADGDTRTDVTFYNLPGHLRGKGKITKIDSVTFSSDSYPEGSGDYMVHLQGSDASMDHKPIRYGNTTYKKMKPSLDKFVQWINEKYPPVSGGAVAVGVVGVTVGTTTSTGECKVTNTFNKKAVIETVVAVRRDINDRCVKLNEAAAAQGQASMTAALAGDRNNAKSVQTILPTNRDAFLKNIDQVLLKLNLIAEDTVDMSVVSNYMMDADLAWSQVPRFNIVINF